MQNHNPNPDNINLSKLRDAVGALMPEVSVMLIEYFNSRSFTKTGKGQFDFATTADLETDVFLIEKLKKAYPSIPFLTEESAHDDLMVYDKMPYVWVIDPLDGTFNFAKGDPNFACSIALVSYGKTIMGMCLNPLAKKLYHATMDEISAHCNGRELKVGEAAQLVEVGIYTNWSHYTEGKEKIILFMQKMMHHIRTIRLGGSAVNDLLAVVDGRADAYYDVKHMPWDMAAASFIAQKAGVKVTDCAGAPYELLTPGMLAAHPKLHTQLLQILQKK